MKRRIMSALLCLCLIAALLPVSVLAAGEKYLALGDSISTGYSPFDTGTSHDGSEEEEDYYTVSDPFVDQIAAYYGYTFNNLAKNGETSTSLLEKLNDGTIDVTGCDLITITIGGNDMMNPLYEYLAAEYNATKENKDEYITAELIKNLFVEPAGFTYYLDVLPIVLSGIQQFQRSDSFETAIETLRGNLTSIIAEIRQDNPTATIVITTQYDPYSNLDENDAGVFKQYVEPTKRAFAACVQEVNDTINAAVNASNYSNVKLADVYTAFKTTGGYLTNAYFSKLNFDFHPNQAGHDLIAETIEGELGTAKTSMKVTPGRTYTFPTLEEGYAETDVSSKTFTFENTGTDSLTGIKVGFASEGTTIGTVDTNDYFTLTTTDMADTLNADTETSFIVTPKTELSADIYTATVKVSADGVRDVNIEISVTVVSEPAEIDHQLLDADGKLLYSNDDLSYVLEMANNYVIGSNDECTVVIGHEDELDVVLLPKVTVRVPDGMTLNIPEVVNMTGCTLDIEAGATIKLLNSEGSLETFIGAKDDNTARVQLTEGSIVWGRGAFTLTAGSKATLTSGQTLSLMATINNVNTPLNAVIEEGATFTVPKGSTLKAVSGNNAMFTEGSKVTVNGTLDVQGTLSIAMKASVEVAEGGALNLAGLSVAGLGNIVVYKDGKLNYDNKPIFGGSDDIIKLTSGKATLNLSNIKTNPTEVASSYIDLKVDGKVIAKGNACFSLTVPIVGTVNVPVHITLESGSTATIAADSTFNLMNGSAVGQTSLGGSQLAVSDGAALNVVGTLEIQDKAALSGTANVTGKVYVFGDGSNMTNATTFDITNSGAVYAQTDSLSADMGTAQRQDVNESYGTATFTSKWRISNIDITPAEPVFDFNTKDDVEFTIGNLDGAEDIKEVKLGDETLTNVEDYSYDAQADKITLTINADTLEELEPGEYTLTVTLNDSSTVSAKITIPATYKVTAVSEPSGAGTFNFNGVSNVSEYYVTKGQSVTITPVGNTGYIFNSWKSAPEDAAIGQNGAITFTPSADTTLTAVFEESAYTIDITPAGLDFGSAYEGYGEIAAQTVTITNNSDAAVEIAAPANSDYDITMQTTQLAAEASVEVTIRPKTGLTAGAHNAELVFSANAEGSKVAEARLNVSFTVSVRDAYTVTLIYGNGAANEVVYVEKGGNYLLPAGPVHSGYAFIGWAGSDGRLYSAGDSVTVSSDMTFTASWVRHPDIEYIPEPDEPSEPDEPETPVFPFYDVSTSAWYYTAVKYVYDKGLMDGVDTYVFAPNDTLTRAMVWTMLARMSGVDTTGGNTWYAKAQEWVVVNGISDGEDPNAAITREQLVTMLWRCSGSETTTGSLTRYPDYAEISSWADQAMLWAAVEGVIEGDENGMINPAATATRAQAAAMLMRFMENVK